MTNGEGLPTLEQACQAFMEGTRTGTWSDHTYEQIFIPEPFRRTLLTARRYLNGLHFEYEASVCLVGGRGLEPTGNFPVENPRAAYNLARSHMSL